jgi:hypothetical protein
VTALDGFELGAPIGAGGHGTVVRAKQRSVGGREVALKRVAVASGSAERLRREAEVLASLDHPHIVRILDVIEEADGVALVMPLAVGGSLAALLAERGQLADCAVAALGARLADALASAHRHGVLHLDVKPDNVLLTADGEPLLADFGIACLADDAAPVAGTPGFVAPEVLAGAASARSDVFSLAEVCRLALGEHADPDLVAIIDRARAADPDDRPEARELAAALRPHAGQLARPTAPPVAVDAVSTRTFGPRPPRPGNDRATPRRRPGAAAIIAAAVVAIAAAVGMGPWRSDRPAPVGAARVAECPGQPPVAAPAAAVLQGDLDGSGCTTVVVWSATLAEARVPQPDGEARYLLGRPGDAMLLGDWDCDGTDTPALYRPSTGEVFLFDGWAGGELPVSSDRPRQTRTAGGAATVTSDDGCDRVEVAEGSAI